MTNYVVELSDETAALVAALSMGKGLTFEEVQDKFNLSQTTANQMLRYLRRASKNLIFSRKRGRINVAYKSLPQEFKVTVGQELLKAGKSNGALKAGTAVAQGKSGGSTHEKSELMWPTAPEIPDVKEEYGWYNKMPFHNRVYDHLFIDGHNLRLAGPPGIGKTSVIDVIAAKEHIPLVSVPGESGLRYRDLVGHITDLGLFEVAEWAAAVVFGWWAKIEEANAMEPGAALAFNSVLAPPRRLIIHGKTFPVHPKFRMVVTYNPNLHGTNALPESLKNRLYPIKVSFPSEAMLYKMLESNGVDVSDQRAKNLISFGMLCNLKKTLRETQFQITPRDLMYAWSDVKKGMDVAAAIEASIIDGIDSPTDSVAVNNIMVASSKSWY